MCPFPSRKRAHERLIPAMYYKKAPRRGKFRTFAQITFAAGEEQSVAEQLKDARKAARAVAGETAKMRLGLDFSDIANIRVTPEKITLLVKTAIQQNRLRQLLPRITAALGRAGFIASVDIKIRPVTDHIRLRTRTVETNPRTMSETALSAVEEKAGSMNESALKDALLSLARAMRKKQTGPAA